MSVSMKDVALKAKVSTTTVSHVINETRHVSRETRDRVMEAIGELNYSINPVARSLRSGSSGMVGLVASNLTNFFFSDVALSIEEELAPRGLNLIHMNSDEDRVKERLNIERLLRQNVDGLIIAPVGEDCGYMEDLIGGKCPFVFFDRSPSGVFRDTILSTNYEGARCGTEHLLEKGYRRIGFVGSRFDTTIEERIKGFHRAFRDYGIIPDMSLVATGVDRSSHLNELKRGDCYELTRMLWEEKRVDALFCGNDLAVVGAMSYIREKRLAIPEDLAIVSFDDAFWLALTLPGITAVDQDRTEIGKTTARVLLDRMEKGEEPFRERRIATNLVIRRSC